ncbi:MAG: hypothetical protein WA981_05550 [Glaciecola sp.]
MNSFSSNCWSVLGITPIYNEVAIDKAYRAAKLNLVDNEQAIAQLNNAYQQAIALCDLHKHAGADIADPEVERANKRSLPTQSSQVNSTQPPNADHQHKRFSKRTIIGAALVIAGIWLFYNDQPPEADVAVVPVIDPRLSACSKVLDGTPSEALDTCIALAKSGNSTAQKRLIWAYTRPSDDVNWQSAFNWMKVAGKYDMNAKLLSYIFMNIKGNTAELVERGERGITRLVAQNFAPANIILASMFELKQNTIPASSNSLWLLERAFDTNIASLSPIDMAKIYINGYTGKKDEAAAKETLIQAAETFYPLGTNNVAWFLSTSGEHNLATPDYAISLAEKIVEDDAYKERYTFIDTLAAAYAAADMFEDAVKTQQLAIDNIPKTTLPEEALSAIMAEFTARLMLYKNAQPAFETAIYEDKTVFFKTLKLNTINNLLNTFFERIDDSKIEPSLAQGNS